MSFTLFSAALLLAVGAGIFVEVMRGIRRGLVWTAISLSAVVFSALVAAPLAVWLSDTPSQMVGEILLLLLPSVEALTEQFPAITTLVTAGADALISPILFIVFFLILRLITRIAVAILYRARLRPLPDDPADPIYESENAPWHRRHGDLAGGLVGGLCGFMAALILLSPVVGVLSTANTLITGAEALKVKWSALGLSDDQVDSVKETTGDPAVVILEAVGGGVVFDAVACTELNDRRVYLRREAEACMDVVTDMLSVMSLLKNVDAATPEQKETLSRLGARINGSEAAKLIAADTLNRVAGAWLEGKTYMKIARPVCGEFIDPLLTGVLEVCAESDLTCVGRDISTLLNIYLIASEYGLLTNPDHEELADSLGEGGVLDRIYDELMRNPCMTHLAGEMTNMALRIMASAIDWSDLNSVKLEGLMGDLSDAMNLVNSLGTTNEERVQAMKEYTLQYATQYGLQVPDALAEMAAIAMIDKLGNTGGQLTADDLYDLFEAYRSGQ